jgi:microcystin-dependent protein
MPWTAGVYTRWNSVNVPPYWVGDASVGIKIEASRHDTQDDDFETGINACLNKDGSNAATGNLNIGSFRLTNVGNASVSTDAVNLAQLQAIVPSGTITGFGGGSAPTGWFLCNGQLISRVTYAALFGVVGTTYGAGDGLTTFAVPNLQQRFPLGKAASGTGATLGGTGGAIDHAHTVSGHYHSTSGTGSALTAAGQSLGTTNKTITGTVGGSDGTHDHDLKQEAGGGGTSDGSAANILSLIGSTVTAYKNSANHYTGGGHGHLHSLNAEISHTHAASSVSGNIGKVTGGANGDIDQSTSTNNPPYLVVNYIIKS